MNINKINLFIKLFLLDYYYESYYRLIIQNHKGLHIPYSLFNYRIHSNNMSKMRKESILKYGNELTIDLLNRAYAVNCNHPYGLKID